MAKNSNKEPQPWWGDGLAPHLRWPGTTIELSVQWSAERERWESGSGRFYFDQDAADFVTEFFPLFLQHTVGREFAGKPFQSMPYQIYLDRAWAGWKRTSDGLRRFRKIFAALPKGSGKSEWLSGIAILMAFFDSEPGSEAFIIANDRRQGKIVHDTCKQMIRMNPHLSGLFEILSDSIRRTDTNANDFLQVLSTDVVSKHGFRPHFLGFDEFHGMGDRDLYEALVRGLGKRSQPLCAVISTAGDDDQGICREEWELCQRVITDPSLDESCLPLIFEMQPQEDWTSPATWERVNPAYGVTVKEEYLRSECNAAQLEPRKKNSFVRLYLNVWTNAATSWLPIQWWDRCDSTLPPDTELVELDVCAGLDMSQKYDLTAFILCFRQPLPDSGETVTLSAGEDAEPASIPLNYKLILLPHFWIPEDTLREHEKSDGVPYSEWARCGWVTATPGSVIDYSRVHADILKIAARFPRLKSGGQIGFDIAFAGDIAQKLAAAQFTTVEIPQNAQHLSEPSQVFEALLKSGRVIHDGNKVMRWCCENVSIKTDGGGRIRPVKPRTQTKRIDGVVGAIMGLSRLMVAPPTPQYTVFWV